MDTTFDIPSPIEARRLMLERVRAAIDADSPLEAELVASELCAAWFVVAPDLQRSRHGMAAHPWGEWPNVRPLQDLKADLDEIEDPGACLVLVRALVALFTEAAEAAEIAARLETGLFVRGAVAPEWSKQFGEWRFEQAHWLTTTEPGGNRPPGDNLINLVGFSHPSGDRCAFIVHIDPHNYDHIRSIDLTDDYECELNDMRREIEVYGHPLEIEQVSDTTLCCSMSRSIKKTYLHEFQPLRSDLPSIGAFPLLCHLCESIPLPELD